MIVFKQTPKSLFLLLLTTLLLSCKQLSTKTAQIYPSDPEKAEIFTNDVIAFWSAYDELLIDTASNPFEEYLIKGSIGLKDFIPERIESASALKQLVLAEKNYYSKIRSSSFNVLRYEKQIRASYYALKYLYPKAVFPPLYFVIGRTTSGGTASKNGMIIGLENFSDTSFVTNYGRPSLQISFIPSIAAHEIIHFLQKDNPVDSTLLRECIREGSADFIAELIAGSDTKRANGDNVYPYGDMNESKLWEEFSKVMMNKDYGEWLYGQTTDKRPQNLGYWMGYKIVQCYYNNAKDKKKAIDDILNINDYEKFLKQSRYAEKFPKK